MIFSAEYDIALAKDRVRLTNHRSGQTLERRAIRPFSSNGALIADREAVVDLIKEMITEADPYRLLRIWTKANLEIVGSAQPAVDADIFRRIATDLGFVRVRMKNA